MRLNHTHRLVLELVRVAEHGKTDDEITCELFLHPDTARPRRYELVQAGYLKHSGARRRCPGGRTAVVWVATEKREHE